MTLRFLHLTRVRIKALSVGERLIENGIIAFKQMNGDTRYSVNVMVDGRRIHKTIGRESEGVTREQVVRYIEKIRTEAREGRLNLPIARKTHMSFEEAAGAYLTLLRAGGGKLIDRKLRQFDMHLNPYLGKHRLNRVSELDIRGYIKKRRDAGAAAGTVNRELATLSHLYRIASSAAVRWVAKDDVPTIPRLIEGRGRIVALSREQCYALIEAAKADEDPDLWLFVVIGLQTSMRHGEIRRLRFDQFDEDRRRFYIPQAKAGEREQPITLDLAKILAGERHKRLDQTGFIFPPGPGSSSLYRHTFRKAFARAALRAGMDPQTITPHVMRHTAITRLVKAGVDLPTIQRVSGHKTLAMVLRYSHVDGPHIDSATEALSLPAD